MANEKELRKFLSNCTKEELIENHIKLYNELTEKNKIDWRRKLSSRKFWALVAAFSSSVYICITHDEQTAVQIAAIITAGGAVVAYLFAEGWADGQHISE